MIIKKSVYFISLILLVSLVSARQDTWNMKVGSLEVGYDEFTGDFIEGKTKISFRNEKITGYTKIKLENREYIYITFRKLLDDERIEGATHKFYIDATIKTKTNGKFKKYYETITLEFNPIHEFAIISGEYIGYDHDDMGKILRRIIP